MSIQAQKKTTGGGGLDRLTHSDVCRHNGLFFKHDLENQNNLWIAGDFQKKTKWFLNRPRWCMMLHVVQTVNKQNWNEISAKATATETDRIDLEEAAQIWSYEEDVAFLAKMSEKNRNRNWRYRENCKERTWQAWERVHMLAEDTNCWLNLPSSSQDAPGATPTKPFRSLREHVLQVARSYQSTEVLSSSLPKTPEHLKKRGPSPLTERVEPVVKQAKRDTWVYLENFVIEQYNQKLMVEPSPGD